MIAPATRARSPPSGQRFLPSAGGTGDPAPAGFDSSSNPLCGGDLTRDIERSKISKWIVCAFGLGESGPRREYSAFDSGAGSWTTIEVDHGEAPRRLSYDCRSRRSAASDPRPAAPGGT